MSQLDQSTVDRYQPPDGDVYIALVQQYGAASAQVVASAALTGDGAALANAIEGIRGNGAAPLDQNTWSIFGSEIVNDPFAAPLAALNNELSKLAGSAIAGILTNPFVLILAAGGIYLILNHRETVVKIVKGK